MRRSDQSLILSMMVLLWALVGCSATAMTAAHSAQPDHAGPSLDDEGVEAAVAALRRAQLGDDRSLAPSLRIASLYLDRGETAAASRELSRIVGLLEARVVQRPTATTFAELAEADFLIGKTVERTANVAVALGHYERAAGRPHAPDEFQAALTAAYVRAGRFTAAEELLNGTPNAVGSLLIALAYEGARDFAAAERWLQPVLEAIPRSRAVQTLAALAAVEQSAVAGNRNAMAAATGRFFDGLLTDTTDRVVFHAVGRGFESLNESATANRFYRAASLAIGLAPDRTLLNWANRPILRSEIVTAFTAFDAALREQVRRGVERTSSFVLAAPTGAPPRITLDGDSIPPSTEYGFAFVSGIVDHEALVKEVRVEVHSGGEPADGRVRVMRVSRDAAGGEDRVEFVARVALKPGKNKVVVSAVDVGGSGASSVEHVIERKQRPSSRTADLSGRWGLIVSIGRYEQDPRIPARPTTESRVLAERLLAGAPAGHVARMVDEEATRVQIVRQLKLLADLGPSEASEIIVYLDGWVQPALRPDATPAFVFLPFDASAADPSQTGIDLDDIVNLINRWTAPRVVVVANTGYIGRALGRRSAPWRSGVVVLGAAIDRALTPSELPPRAGFLPAMVDSLDRTPIELGEATPSLYDVFDRARTQVVTATRGRQEPVAVGDLDAAREYRVLSEVAAEKLLEQLGAFALQGRLSREAFLVGSGPLTGSLSVINDTIIGILSRFLRKGLTVEEMAAQLTDLSRGLR